jgi:LysR family transcriptional regulator, transcriptional activator for dmlA
LERADLELVLAIRQHGSMAAAARALRLAAPVVTKRLAALEAGLGLRLFQRTTRHVSATAEGDALCQHAAQLLQGFAQAEAELRERRLEPTGPVRLAATFGFGRRWVGPALARFQARHPAISIQLQLTEHLPDLAQEGFDGAIWLWNAPGGRAGEWVSRKLAGNQRVLVAAPAYLAQHTAPRHPDELRQHACLVVRENGGWGGGEGGLPTPARYDHWRLQQTGRTQVHHVPVAGPLSSNSGEMVRDWCLDGHGIMLRSLWDIAPQLASGELVRVLPDWSMPDADVHWLAPYRAQAPRRIRLLVDHLAHCFADEPWKPVSVRRAPPSSRQTR